jgi:hypothetical protein
LFWIQDILNASYNQTTDDVIERSEQHTEYFTLRPFLFVFKTVFLGDIKQVQINSTGNISTIAVSVPIT